MEGVQILELATSTIAVERFESMKPFFDELIRVTSADKLNALFDELRPQLNAEGREILHNLDQVYTNRAALCGCLGLSLGRLLATDPARVLADPMLPPSDGPIL